MADDLHELKLAKAPIGLESGQILQKLWTLRRDAHVMCCVVVAGPEREELRVLVDDDLYLVEPYAHHDGLLGRAHVLHRGLLSRGWTDVEPPATGI